MAEETGLTHADAHEVFESFELADEEMILHELAGRVTDKYVYTFKEKGQEVTGLSKAGTDWAVREYAKQGEVIRVIGKTPEIMLDPTDGDYIWVVVVAQRFIVNRENGKEIALDSRFGTKRQWKNMKKKKYDEGGNVVGEEIVPDPFFMEKAESKASRNALQKLIPTDFVKKMISKALELKNGRAVSAQRSPGRGAPAKPPGATSPPAQGVAAATPPGTAAAPAGAAPAAPAGAAPAPAPAPAPAAAAPVAAPQQGKKISKDTLVQKFDGVLKSVFQTQDGAQVRQHLVKLTGKENVGDLDDETLRSLGNLLMSVGKKQHKMQNYQIVGGDGKVLWNPPQPPAPPPAAAAPPPVAPPAEEEPF